MSDFCCFCEKTWWVPWLPSQYWQATNQPPSLLNKYKEKEIYKEIYKIKKDCTFSTSFFSPPPTCSVSLPIFRQPPFVCAPGRALLSSRQQLSLLAFFQPATIILRPLLLSTVFTPLVLVVTGAIFSIIFCPQRKVIKEFHWFFYLFIYFLKIFLNS